MRFEPCSSCPGRSCWNDMWLRLSLVLIIYSPIPYVTGTRIMSWYCGWQSGGMANQLSANVIDVIRNWFLASTSKDDGQAYSFNIFGQQLMLFVMSNLSITSRINPNVGGNNVGLHARSALWVDESVDSGLIWANNLFTKSITTSLGLVAASSHNDSTSC